MQELLEQLKIKADVIDIKDNGTMAKYFLKLRPGGKVSKIENCANEIALGLKSYSIPIIRLIPERGLVSVELLIKQHSIVNFDDLYKSLNLNDMTLPVILGKSYDGEDLIADLVKMPHLLVAGTTGSGKSVLLHSIICSLLSNDNIKLALIDPKNVEFIYYQDIKQLLYPIANYADDANLTISNLVNEMNYRFKIMAKRSAKNIEEYNKKNNKLPYIVLIIDEYADLIQISKKVFQSNLGMLAQKSRACGIHIILATQRPSADIVTGIIKANFPARVSCHVTSSINSRVILDQTGAEKLLGKGDAIIHSSIYDMLRFKGAFIEEERIQEICDFNKRNWFDSIIYNMRYV